MELRYEVFCVEQGVPRSEERDGRDHQALHLVAVEDGEMLGTCRLVFTGSTVQFSRLAVRADARRRGIARRCSPRPTGRRWLGRANRLVLHAQTYALPLYRAAGYQTRGRVFVEAGIEHVAMEKVL